MTTSSSCFLIDRSFSSSTTKGEPAKKSVTKKRAKVAAPAQAAPAQAVATLTEPDDMKAAKALDPTGATTIVYVHGIGNKPPASVLKAQWDNALFGFDLIT